MVAVRSHFWKAVHGNDAFHENNVAGRQTLRRLRKLSPDIQLDEVSTGLARTLGRDGFVRLPGIPDPDALAAVQAAYAQVIEDPSATVDMGGRIEDVVRYVKDPLGLVPEIRNLVHPLVPEVLAGYYGTPARLMHVRMWRIKHLSFDEQRVHHYGNLWHNDRHPTTTMKLFIQISDDVTDERGAFRLIRRPDTRRLMRSGYLSTSRIVGPAAKIVSDTNRVTLFDDPAGTCAFVDTTRSLHRAGVPCEGVTRGMLQLTFEPTAEAYSNDLFANLPRDASVVQGAVA